MNTNARELLENSIGVLSIGKTLRAIRLGDEETLKSFAKKIGISVQYLCDLEHDRKIVSPKKAQEFAKSLGYPHEQFVALALQDLLDHYNIPMHVAVTSA